MWNTEGIRSVYNFLLFFITLYFIEQYRRLRQTWKTMGKHKTNNSTIAYTNTIEFISIFLIFFYID